MTFLDLPTSPKTPRAKRFSLLANLSSPNRSPEHPPLSPSPAMGELIVGAIHAASPRQQGGGSILAPAAHLKPPPVPGRALRSTSPASTSHSGTRPLTPILDSSTKLSADPTITADTSSHPPHDGSEPDSQPVRPTEVRTPGLRTFRSGSMQVSPSKGSLTGSASPSHPVLSPSLPQRVQHSEPQASTESQMDVDELLPTQQSLRTESSGDHASSSQAHSLSLGSFSESQGTASEYTQSQWPIQTQAPYTFPSQSEDEETQ